MCLILGGFLWSAYRAVRQEQLNRRLIAAIKQNKLGYRSIAEVLTCLKRGADPDDIHEEHLRHIQWLPDGKLLGSYTMDHGTGIDLWWQGWSDGSAQLAEVHYERNGSSHGFEWWLNSDASLREERHWQEGTQHGIEREWNLGSGLRRGYPRYYVYDGRVTKRQYITACTKDATLPPFRLEDNSSQRVFPPEIAVHL